MIHTYVLVFTQFSKLKSLLIARAFLGDFRLYNVIGTSYLSFWLLIAKPFKGLWYRSVQILLL